MNVTINSKNYEFVTDFKDDPSCRYGFNTLAKKIFDFDFEDYYQSGYWNSRYIPYALMDDGNVAANVSINVLDFSVLGEQKRYVQLGTVMTDPAYRKRGLSRYLLNTVINQWQDKSDMIYLFANDTVLDFYPKFGFLPKKEYQYICQLPDNSPENSSDNSPCQPTDIKVRHLDMDSKENRELLFRLSDSTRCFSKLSAMQNTGLVMFYGTSFMKDCIYYIEHLDAAVFVEYRGRTMFLNDIFCPNAISLEAVISAMAKEDTDEIVFGFTPDDTGRYQCRPYFKKNTTLFVLGKGQSIFDGHQLMFPILSHS